MKKKMMAAAVAAALFLTACGGAASGTGAKSAETTSKIPQNRSAESISSKSDTAAADSASGNPRSGNLPADSSQNGSLPDEVDSADADRFPSFAAADLEGGEISDKIFANAKLTVVNIWGTFCGPCIQEMPYLGELSAELANDGVQLVGLICDVTDLEGNVYPEQVKEAKNIVEMTGAAYAHIIPSKDLSEILQNTMYVPTTYLVDAEGRILGEPLVGSRTKEDWKSVIMQNIPA